jgi:hypothetical protein
MASDRDQWADSLSPDNSAGWLTGFLAEEDEFDRRSLWRIGSWGVGSVAAVIVAVLANQQSAGFRREQTASADLMRQAQQVQWVAKESQNENRRLSSAIETLNGDRDRLYSRIAVLEQGLDAVTGSIARPDAGTASSAAADSASSPSSASMAAAAPPSADPAVGRGAASSANDGASPTASPPAPALGGAPPTAAATADKTSTVAALTPDPSPARAAPSSARPATTSNAAPDKASPPAAPQPDPPLGASTSPRPASKASAAAITAPTTTSAAPTTATAAPATATAAPATATAAPEMAAAPPATAALGMITSGPIAPAIPLMPAKSIMAPPDSAATRFVETDAAAATAQPAAAAQIVASAPAMTEPDPPETVAAPAVAIQRTAFGVDLGGANSIDGLRALWAGLLKYRSNKALGELRPIIVVKERSNGLGMQLRLVAGPLGDAAAAAKICATLTESDRTCETTIFDGQRLALKGDNSPAGSAPAANSFNQRPAAAPAPVRPSRRRSIPKGARIEEPAPAPPPPKSSLTSFLGLR